jgi:hypothetical protein
MLRVGHQSYLRDALQSVAGRWYGAFVPVIALRGKGMPTVAVGEKSTQSLARISEMDERSTCEQIQNDKLSIRTVTGCGRAQVNLAKEFHGMADFSHLAIRKNRLTCHLCRVLALRASYQVEHREVRTNVHPPNCMITQSCLQCV